MKRIGTTALLVAMMLFLVPKASAKKVFNHFDMKKGLSQNTVSAIAQDHIGFMWFGTKNGLNRFDGQYFRVYHEGSDGHSLKSDYINALCEGTDNRLWIGTSDGLFIYNPQTDYFEELDAKTKTGVSIKGNVRIVTAAGNYMYVSTQEQGIFRYDIKTGQLIFKPHGTLMVPTHITVDDNGVLWLGFYGSGLYTANSDLSGMEPVRDNNGRTLFSNTNISDIVCTEQRQLFVSTETTGVSMVNLDTHEVTLLMPEPGERGCNVHSLLRNENELWAATEDGLYVYEMLTQNTKHYQYESTDPFSLSDNPLQTLFCDRDGGVWIGTYFGGVNYTPLRGLGIDRFFPRIDKENSLHGRRVREIVEDSQGMIWIGTEDGGLNVYNPKTGNIEWISESRMFANIHGLCADGDYLWVGTYTYGLKLLDTRTHRIVKSFSADGKPGSLRDNNIFSVMKSRKGRIYFGTLSGLCVYDNGTFNYVSGVPRTIIYDMKEDKSGNIWVGTYGEGVYMLPAGSRKWKVFDVKSGQLPSDNVLSIAATSNGDVWVSTEGGNVNCWHNGKFTRVTLINDDPNTIVYDIVEDRNRKLWFTTDNGMIGYDPVDKTTQVLKTANGLLDNNFNYKSSFCASNGRIYAGSLSGFISFMPETMHNTVRIPTIVATELLINNSVVDNFSKDSPLKQSITMTNKLVLSYSQRSFTIKMATLLYNAEQQPQLEYKLDGFDKEWQPLSNSHLIRYTNLPSGNYRLFVRTQNTKENVNGQQYELAVKVKPPLLLTWWAIVLYVLLVGIFVLFMWRNISQRIGMRRRLAMEKFQHEKEHELYQSKIKFFTNVAHEIRTPLTLIKAPLENLMKNGGSDSLVNRELDIMNQNVNRLLDLTRQLLDFRKAERDGMKLNFESCDIGNVIDSVYVRFSTLIEKKGIKAGFLCPRQPLCADVDKEALTKIVSNLVNNAVKYCDRKFRIELHVKGNEFWIITRNDGNLVSPAMRTEIFSPFVRGNDVPSNISGMGIGLALARTLAELHGGTLEMKNDQKDNVFCLTMPVNQEKAISIAEPEPALPEPEENEEVTEKNAPTILVVEDNLQMQQYEKQNLQREYNVLTADNGEEALKILAERHVDAIVSDVMMEPMDGFALCRKVKTDVNISHIPLVLLTALTLDASKIEGMEAGADAYIEKPFSMDYLFSTIKNLLRTRQNAKTAYAQSPFVSSESLSISKADEEFIERLNAVMEKNISDSDFSISDMASQMFMSRTGLNRKIRGVFNLTSNNYIKMERLKKAANLMRTKDYKVNEVCYMVGFTSPSYFTQCFYKQFGLLPKDFINADRQKSAD